MNLLVNALKLALADVATAKGLDKARRPGEWTR